MFMILRRYVELQPAWFKVKAKSHATITDIGKTHVVVK